MDTSNTGEEDFLTGIGYKPRAIIKNGMIYGLGIYNMYLANKVQNIKGSADVLLDCAGLTFDELRPVADAMERGGRKAAAKAVTDEILRKVCPIAGTPDECAQRIQEYRDAGCTHIMLEIWGDDRTGQAKLFGEAVLPQFKR